MAAVIKLILIARVSDVEQRKALPAQKLKLKQYAAPIDPRAEYHEFDESAFSSGARKKFSRLVEHIKERSQKELIGAVFLKCDRYSRNEYQEEVRTLNQLVRQGKVELHFPDDNLFITKDSPATDLFRLGIGTALAKYYSDSIKDNVHRRFNQMLHDGVRPGFAPCGFLNVNLGTIAKPIKDIIVDTERAPFIIEIYEKRSTGMPYTAITNLVNSKGMTTKSGRPMTVANVEKILCNPFYYGFMRYNDKLYKHKYPPLITKDLYDKCQLVREKRYSKRNAYKSVPYTFSDILKCGDCGCSMTPYVVKGHAYLKCTRAKKNVTCTNINVAERLVLPQLEQALRSVRMSDKDMTLLVQALQERFGNQQDYLDKVIAETREEYDDIKAKLKALTYERIEAVKKGRGLSDELFDQVAEELTAKQNELDVKLQTLTNANFNFLTTLSQLLSLAQNLNQLFKEADATTQNKILRFALPANSTIYAKVLWCKLDNTLALLALLSKKEQNGFDSNNWCG